jgi:hypothetical protein
MIIFEKVINKGTDKETIVECEEAEAEFIHYHYEDKSCHRVPKNKITQQTARI